MSVIQQLKTDGTAKGLCRLWRARLKEGMTDEEMVKMYIAGIDFCISENYPTLDYLRENFKGRSEQYGVFMDDELEMKNLPNMVLNGACKAFLEYDNYSVSRLFIRHNSIVSVNVSEYALASIDIFDSAELFVATSSHGRAIVNVYGDAKVKTLGEDIKVCYKHKITY